MSDPRIDEIVRTVLTLPLHQSLGLRLATDGEPADGIELVVGQATMNPSRVLHGGLVPLVLDVACFLRLLPDLTTMPSRAGVHPHAVTVSSSASIIAAAREGEVVRVTAQVERLGRTHAFLSGRLCVGDKVVATGQVVKAVVEAQPVSR